MLDRAELICWYRIFDPAGAQIGIPLKGAVVFCEEFALELPDG
jgi:hypothetical protein